MADAQDALEAAVPTAQALIKMPLVPEAAMGNPQEDPASLQEKSAKEEDRMVICENKARKKESKCEGNRFFHLKCLKLTRVPKENPWLEAEVKCQKLEASSQPLQNYKRCEQIHLADTGKLYWKVPLRFFVNTTWINLNRTTISSKDFLKFVGMARHLDTLNIESCEGISEQAIFKAKGSLQSLRNINVSYNEQFSILTIACLCSFNSVQDIRARGLNLESKELLFLRKTFPRISYGLIPLDIGSGDYFVDALNAVSEFDLFEDL
ncbi:hypothetical protein ACROYT_G014704 [Oculina patagonica]